MPSPITGYTAPGGGAAAAATWYIMGGAALCCMPIGPAGTMPTPWPWPAKAPRTTPAFTRKSSSVISPSVACRPLAATPPPLAAWGCATGCGAALAWKSAGPWLISAQTSSTVFRDSGGGSANEPCRTSPLPLPPPPPFSPVPVVVATGTGSRSAPSLLQPAVAAWNSSAFHMLAMNSSMFMDPKLRPGSHSEFCSSSSVSDIMDDCRASGSTACCCCCCSSAASLVWARECCEVTSCSSRAFTFLLISDAISQSTYETGSF
uniref:Uncharacterized protein n=1 Tax=Zea mays TaxID=4577 RepID=C4J130_MAIZE|nr:unknown [Zea mays]